MSASKKDELLKSLTRRDAQKPPIDVTYEAKGEVLEQMLGRPTASETPASTNVNDNNHVIDDAFINNDINNIVNENVNNDVDVNVNHNDDGNDFNNNDDNVNANNTLDEVAATSSADSIDALLNANKKASSNKTLKGFYLDPDIARTLDKLAKKHGKGIQSQLVNEALRMVFTSKGLL